MDLEAWLPLITVAIAVVGAFLTVLKYPQERSTSLIGQQSTVLSNMKTLNDDLIETADRGKIERAELLAEITTCRTEIGSLKQEIRTLRYEIQSLKGGR